MDPLVSTEWLPGELSRADLVVADVRWYPDRPGGSREAFTKGHIPGAVFLDLDVDLSDRSDLSRGRRPLEHSQARSAH